VAIISGERVDLKLVHLTIDEVVESAMLSSRFALIPVVDLREAHARGELLSFDAIYHALMEGVTRVGLQGDR
jgi:hypothetical protein